MMKMRLTIAAAALVATGCGSIQQRVDPVARGEEKEICLQPNAAARDTFLTTYQKALERKGFTVIIVPEQGSTAGCRLVSNYQARWGWGGFTMSMTYADLRIIRDGVIAGRATYNATSSRSPEKMINAEDKIVELVNQLFPYR
jgi:hypothetical protein